MAMTLNQKQTVLALLLSGKFNLSPQEMQVALQAITALQEELNTELKGGDPEAGEVK